MYINIIKNLLRTFLGLNREKNQNIKAWQKKGCSYKKKVYIGFFRRSRFKRSYMIGIRRDDKCTVNWKKNYSAGNYMAWHT